MRETFAISADGTLTAIKPLKRSIRSVYSVPIVEQPMGGRPLSRTFIVGTSCFANVSMVFVDEDASATEILPEANATTLLIDPVTELDLKAMALGSSAICQPINNDRYEVSHVSSDCLVTIEQSIDADVIATAINNQTVEVALRALKILPKLESSMLQLVLYALPSGIAELLSELQRTYADLTFYPIAVDTVTYRTTLLLTILDRNHKVIAAKDSLDIVRSFLQKDEFPHILLESMETDLCANITCANAGVCRQRVLYKNRSLTLAAPGSIWSIPEGVGVARCDCKPGFTGEWCDDVKKCDDVTCPNGKCTLGGDCIRDCEKTCKK
ncbi:hypothetical protein OESDEN_13631 [Oesophagostomum dentatum]|uniref:EGF-like domain-containing protein n=1 Tax=Oesophagostomum dentatum TaxID=61180 RepID=A0A0B1SRV3_OESDE|nr:hypothetical protein OESDEN_13631 [Oesophagostomum dentatum]